MSEANAAGEGGVKPPFPYFAGKGKLAPVLAHAFDKVDHDHYSEPFCGSFSVGLAKQPVAKETANDLWSAVINAHLCLQESPERVRDLLTDIFGLQHETLCKQSLELVRDETGDKFERAAALFYATYHTVLKNFSSWESMPPSTQPWPEQIIKRLTDSVLRRYRGVRFSCRPFENFLDRLDKCGPETLVYLDPPYPGTSPPTSGRQGYIGKFDDEAFTRLLTRLADAPYMWALSSFPHPVLARFAETYGWRVREFDMALDANVINPQDSRTRKTELVVSSFELPLATQPALGLDFPG